MAKRSRRAVGSRSPNSRPGPAADRVPTSPAGSRTTSRAHSRHAPQPSALDRYRSALIAGVAVIGLLVIGYFFFIGQGGSANAAYNCLSELNPEPMETVTPIPSILPTPTPSTSPSASTGASAGAPASPSASAQPSATAAPSPSGSASPAPLPTPRLGFTTAILGRDHVATGSTISYGFCPPDSGNHYNQPPKGPIPATIYGPQAEEAPGGWVHNLEHGYVVVLYRCPSGTLGTGDCISSDQYAQLQAFFNQAPQSTVPSCPNKVIVARFDSMTTKFAEIAWGRVYLSNQFDLDTANTFVQQWMDHPEVPERYSCAT